MQTVNLTLQHQPPGPFQRVRELWGLKKGTLSPAGNSRKSNIHDLSRKLYPQNPRNSYRLKIIKEYSWSVVLTTGTDLLNSILQDTDFVATDKCPTVGGCLGWQRLRST